MDDLDEVVWQPYKFTEAWVKDDDEMFFFWFMIFSWLDSLDDREILLHAGCETVWTMVGHVTGISALCTGTVREASMGANLGV